MELAEAAGLVTHQGRLGLAELVSASEVFLTSSLTGLRPVASLGGLPQMADLRWSSDRPGLGELLPRYLRRVGLASRNGRGLR